MYAYRDSRTEDVIAQVHEKLPFSELYCRTGCQFQPFNTIYQLYADKVSGRLDKATDLLMMPEYLLYRLCGVRAREYTNATTTGMVSAQTGEFDEEILKALGYQKSLFPKLSRPGTVLGEYEGIQCVLCATHDTASAVEGIPMEGNEPYISSGTWSLLGVKTPKPMTDPASEKANYSNEGGVGYNRYQKNIMGIWLVNELQKELCPDRSFGEIVKAAEASTCQILVDANAPEFFAPASMKSAFDRAAGHRLKTEGDYFRCAYRSLADSYRAALEELERNTGTTYGRLYIVGGGAKNTFLNRLTEDATGKQVIALPIEATALGNLSYRMKPEEAEQCRSFFCTPGEWVPMGVTGQNLAGEYFITTGSGKYFRNVILDPVHSIGIVEINEEGNAWRIVWGLEDGGKPTSEFPTHFMNHSIRSAATGGACRVIYHAHIPNLIAMTYTLPLTDKAFSRALWKSATECPVVFPDGVGVVPWMVPGGTQIALATSKLMEKYDAAVWAHHGAVCSGPDFDTTFGLMHTIEKAAEIYNLVMSSGQGQVRQTITDDNLRTIAKEFGVVLNEEFLE